MKFPRELLEKIFIYLDLEKILCLGYDRLLKTKYNPVKHTLDWAIFKGYKKTLLWLYKNNLSKFTIYSSSIASKKGYLDILKFLHKIDTAYCNYSTYLLAIENGHVHILEWLSSLDLKFCNSECMNVAVRNDDLQTLKWLYRNHENCKPCVALKWAETNKYYRIKNWLDKRLIR